MLCETYLLMSFHNENLYICLQHTNTFLNCKCEKRNTQCNNRCRKTFYKLSLKLVRHLEINSYHLYDYNKENSYVNFTARRRQNSSKNFLVVMMVLFKCLQLAVQIIAENRMNIAFFLLSEFRANAHLRMQFLQHFSR